MKETMADIIKFPVKTIIEKNLKEKEIRKQEAMRKGIEKVCKEIKWF